MSLKHVLGVSAHLLFFHPESVRRARCEVCCMDEQDFLTVLPRVDGVPVAKRTLGDDSRRVVQCRHVNGRLVF